MIDPNPIVDASKFCLFAHGFKVDDSWFTPNVDQMFVMNRYFYRPRAAIFKKNRNVGMSTLFMLLALYECMNSAKVHVYSPNTAISVNNARIFDAFVSKTDVKTSGSRLTREFSNGAFIDFHVATIPNLCSVRGDVAFIDEAQHIRDDLFIKEAYTCFNSVIVAWTTKDMTMKFPVSDTYSQVVCNLTG